MHAATKVVRQEAPPARSFDVICAGEPSWKLAALGGSRAVRTPASLLRPGGGAVGVALGLARRGLRVGLATVLTDDAFGRDSLERLARLGVDVGGVTLARPRGGLVMVDAQGGARPAVAEAEERPPLELPEGWSASVLLLSGLSPVVAHAAALCKAARAARRDGSVVVLDFDASLHAWAGREPRTIRMVLREVDVARCSLADLAVLGTDAATVRAALRPSAVLVLNATHGGLVATGPFGEVAAMAPQGERPGGPGSGDALTAALCAELTSSGDPGESASARWSRALQRGLDARRAVG